MMTPNQLRTRLDVTIPASSSSRLLSPHHGGDEDPPPPIVRRAHAWTWHIDAPPLATSSSSSSSNNNKSNTCTPPPTSTSSGDGMKNSNLFLTHTEAIGRSELPIMRGGNFFSLSAWYNMYNMSHAAFQSRSNAATSSSSSRRPTTTTTTGGGAGGGGAAAAADFDARTAYSYQWPEDDASSSGSSYNHDDNDWLLDYPSPDRRPMNFLEVSW